MAQTSILKALRGEPETKEATGAPVLYLVRHGRTDANDKGVFRGWNDDPINEQGKAQAHDAAKFLKDKGITKVYSSNLTHAQQTAGIIVNDLGLEKVEYDPDLRAWNTGTLAGKPMEENKDVIADLVAHPDKIAPGGESLNQFIERYIKRLKYYITEATDETPTLLSVQGSNIIASAKWANQDGTQSVAHGAIYAIYKDGDKYRGQRVFGEDTPGDYMN
jgi:broad specificity phosphatase PhoE